MARRVTLSGLGVAVLLALGGCSTAPTSVPPSKTPPRTQAPASSETPAAESSSVTEQAPASPAPDVQPPVTAAKPATPPMPAAPPSAATAPATKAPAPTQSTTPAPATPAKSATPAPASPKQPKDSHTFIVTAAQKDKSHPYFGAGHALGFFVNGEPGKDLVLTRGESYIFDVDTGVQHDFYFSTNPMGWGAGTVTDGIEGQFTYKGEVTFKPSSTTPDVLYYECRNHKYMGGKIYVVNKGEQPKMEAKKVIEDATPKTQVTHAQVKQKVSYAQMLLAPTSEVVKRVTGSGNQEAIQLQSQAKTELEKAKQELAGGNVEAALAAADEALRLIKDSSARVPSESVGIDHKAKYAELHKEVKQYADSYAKNIKAGQGKQASSTFDKAKFDGLVRDAESLAAKGDYEAANKNLTQAATQVTAVLTLMLDSQTVVYDKSFATPKEEYEYEAARYVSFHELVPIAIEQRSPSPQQRKLLDDLVAKAERIVSEGKGFAERGDYTTAIQAMQAATENIERGLMLIGVR